MAGVRKRANFAHDEDCVFLRKKLDGTDGLGLKVSSALYVAKHKHGRSHPLSDNRLLHTRQGCRRTSLQPLENDVVIASDQRKVCPVAHLGEDR